MSSSSSSSPTRVVLIAVAGGLAVTVTKFVAGAVAGSASMLAEGVHSLVDTGNDLMLYVGIRRNQKPADASHPFGYGKELYFWTLIAALGLLAAGGGITIAQGVSRLLNPREVDHVAGSFIVLAISAVFEGYTWVVSYRQLRKAHPDLGVWEAVRRGKDPTNFTVLIEDSAALIGLVIAAAGIALSAGLGSAYPDAIASILIGLLLGATAVILADESRKLLVGESADAHKVDAIKALVEADPAVEHAPRPLTMHLGPDEILLNLEVQFREGLSAVEIERAIDRLERTIRDKYKECSRIFIEAESLTNERRRAHAEGCPA